MRKLAIYLLDALIVLAICWVFIFRNYFESFWAFVATTITLLTSVIAGTYIATRMKDRSQQQRVALEERRVAHQEAQQAAERQLMEQRTRERRQKLEQEHEARRPVCGHCGKKTEGVFLHRRIDGSPDRRYRENPVLCNRCLKPYQPVRPWNLPHATQGDDQTSRGPGEA